MSHNLAAAGGGWLWPGLTFSNDGATIKAIAKADDPDNNQPIRFLRDYKGHIDAADFEAAIDIFINTVIAGMSPDLRAETGLPEKWNEAVRQRADTPDLPDGY